MGKSTHVTPLNRRESESKSYSTPPAKIETDWSLLSGTRNLLHSYWKWHIYSGFTHWKWWFSIAMWQFTRGYIWQDLTFPSCWLLSAKSLSTVVISHQKEVAPQRQSWHSGRHFKPRKRKTMGSKYGDMTNVFLGAGVSKFQYWPS